MQVCQAQKENTLTGSPAWFKIEIQMLARCVFMVDKQGLVRYRRLVEQTGQEPNYDEVIDAVKNLV